MTTTVQDIIDFVKSKNSKKCYDKQHFQLD